MHTVSHKQWSQAQNIWLLQERNFTGEYLVPSWLGHFYKVGIISIIPFLVLFDKSTEFKLWWFCSAECGFESRSWHLCPWARHFTIIASLHPGVNGYLWVQRRFLWLIWPSSAFAAQGCILPSELRWFKEWFKAQWPGVIMLERHERHCVTDLSAI